MQVVETSNQGLKRALKVTIPKGELASRFSAKLEEVKGQVNLKGFRPGKVPVAHLKRVYGKSIMAEVLQTTVTETTQKALDERKERAALTPDIKFTEDQAQIEKMLAGEEDVAFDMTYEVVPKFTVADLSGIAIDKPVAEVSTAEIDKSLGELLKSGTTYLGVFGREAAKGDQVTIDFVGSIDGKEFEGGKGEDAPVVIGSNGFIPGFEEGLIGAKAGDKRTVQATFPEAYGEKSLAGKTASFAVTVKDVAEGTVPEADDEFAKRFGLDSIDDLRTALKDRIKREYDGAARQHMKRSLLDALDGKHAFDLPPTLVESEYDGIWKRFEADMKKSGATFESLGKTEDSEKAEYRKLAERRVRLGLVLSEIGEKAEVKVTDDEMARAVGQQASRFPGQEQHVYRYFRENPSQLLSIRAPIYEEKVVDHILGKVTLNDKPMSPEELMKAMQDEEEDDHVHFPGDGHDHDHDGHDNDHGHKHT